MIPVRFDAWTSTSSLWQAARRAARGKRHRAAVARSMLDLESVVCELHEALCSGAWRPGNPSQHTIFDPKQRRIVAAPFRDRIVHQALCSYVGPLLERGLIGDTYACRTGLGTHAALRRASSWCRGYRFALHLDVKKYFPSIDHHILTRQLERAIPCPRTVEVCRAILQSDAIHVQPSRFHCPGDDLFTPFERTMGLPIGNLTSQHFANQFLSPVDHRARDRLRIHPYLRYMDDMLLFDDDAARLRDWGAQLEAACHRQRLRLHPWRVVPTRAGVPWLGFRILPSEIRVKRTSVRRAETKLAQRWAMARTNPEEMDGFLSSLRSVLAHWKHGSTWRLRERTLRKLGLFHDQVYPHEQVDPDDETQSGQEQGDEDIEVDEEVLE